MKMSFPRASLRTYLLTLTIGAIVPVLCFAGYLIIGLGRSERKAIERGLIETTGALTSSVDRELTSTITTLETLATSRSLDRGDYRMFLEEVTRVLDNEDRHGWLTIHLASPDGKTLMNSADPAGTPLPLVDVATVKRTAASAQPVISDLLAGAVRGQPAFAVRVP